MTGRDVFVVLRYFCNAILSCVLLFLLYHCSDVTYRCFFAIIPLAFKSINFQRGIII